LRLLLIDDERAILIPLSRYLRSRGLEVDTAEDGASALALLGERLYDVVVSDLRLSPAHPDEGLELLARVPERHPRARRVLLTAFGSPEVEARAARLGIDRVLSKPLPLERLLATLRELMEGEGSAL